MSITSATEILPADEGGEDIKATTSLVDRALRNLKHGHAFAVLDSFGDVGSVADTPEGVFYRDTRHLSRSLLTLNGLRPLLLSSTAHDDKTAVSVDLTNPDMECDGAWLPRDTIFIERTKFLWRGSLYERIGLRNYDVNARRVRLELTFDADFRDLFEVRGMARQNRGNARFTTGDSRIEFSYSGLDAVQRKTFLHFSPRPSRLEGKTVLFEVSLAPHQQASFFAVFDCEGRPAQELSTFATAYRNLRRERRRLARSAAQIESSNHVFNEVIGRATSDLYMLATPSANGIYPFAGIPWYSTIFGRDGILTAILTLWLDPAFARGVLLSLAATQAVKFDAAADAQPGKILHEQRFGEMANLREVPFGLYYGTVDATPLFVLLAGLYFQRTGDRETVERIWPNIEAALDWIDKFGDPDGDGFVEYQVQAENGLRNQGWKDSGDSIFHANGELVRGPTALCEVQAYVYAAKRTISETAEALGKTDLAAMLNRQAQQLQVRFEAAFWCEELNTYAIALDGKKRPCQVQSSNAGHVMFCGLSSPQRAQAVAKTLLNPNNFSGWGIRTLGADQARYNPMSYHNGSIWPHDNALIALGLARYGMKAEAAMLFETMFSVATHQEFRRLPELFCGFLRKRNRGPTSYPVACSPQAWAAATHFGLLSACLGLRVRQGGRMIEFDRPVLPEFIDDLTIRNLGSSEASADLRISRAGAALRVNVLDRKGDVAVSIRE
jgi:glycogen debranching enzyme